MQKRCGIRLDSVEIVRFGSQSAVAKQNSTCEANLKLGSLLVGFISARKSF
jgi:hypothetical protein